MAENKISVEFKAENANAVIENLKNIEKSLSFLIDLSVDDRKNMLKLGDKSRAFVEKSLELALHDDSYLPKKFDVNEMKKDVELYLNLFKVLHTVNNFQKKIEDTFMLAGSEAYSSALTVYAAAKNSNRGGELDTLVDELSKNFVKKQKTVKE